MLPSLTDRQKAIYNFLLKTIREKGFAPSIPEIGLQFKIASTNGVSDHLKALEKKGYIRRVGKRAEGRTEGIGRHHDQPSGCATNGLNTAVRRVRQAASPETPTVIPAKAGTQ